MKINPHLQQPLCPLIPADEQNLSSCNTVCPAAEFLTHSSKYLSQLNGYKGIFQIVTQ